MDFEVFDGFLKQYGFAGGGLIILAYFLIKTVPRDIAPIFAKVLKGHFDKMSEAWDAHKERLDTAERRAEERHGEVLKASREGMRELIAHLQSVHTDMTNKFAEHDVHAVNLANKVGEVIRRDVK